MLFSGGTTTKSSKREEKRERKSDRDEKYEIREAVFIRWADSIIDKNINRVTELRDLTNISFLLAFANLIHGKAPSISGKSDTDDTDTIFQYLVSNENEPTNIEQGNEQRKHKLLLLSIADMHAGVQKVILDVIWQFIQIHWKKFAPPPSNECKMVEALKEWYSEATLNYPDITISDFISSWRDGMALNCLIKSYDESLVDLDEISKLKGEERLDRALNLAQKEFDVSKLITAKDFQNPNLDEKSVACYLSSLYLGIVQKDLFDKQNKRSQKSTAKPSSSGLTSHDVPPDSPRTIAARKQFRQTPTATPSPPHSHEHSPASIPGRSILVPPKSPTKTTAPSPLVRSLQGQSKQNSCSLDQEQPQSPKTISAEEALPPPEKIRSRTSSSSHSRNSSKKYKAALKEHEESVRKVHVWLAESEEELERLCYEERKVGETPDISAVTKIFQEHESFMSSLSESQAGIAGILLKGKQLANATEGEQQNVINAQTKVVSDRWDQLRETSMKRQNKLQQRLDQIQRQHLNKVSKWLSEIESIIANTDPISDEQSVCQEQIVTHFQLQEQIALHEPLILMLSAFVTVVDETPEQQETSQQNTRQNREHFEHFELESILQSIGERWSSVCDWAEKRTKALDGIVELLARYDDSYSKLNEWLTKQQTEIKELKSDKSTECDQIYGQKQHIIAMEAELSAEHPAFVELSQICTELAQRFQLGNNKNASDELHNQLSLITQGWENIVSQLEEHWRVLVQIETEKQASGSQDRMLKRHLSTSGSSGDEKREKIRRNLSLDATEKRSEQTAGDEEHEKFLVSEFLKQIDEMEQRIRPLLRWSQFEENISAEKQGKETLKQKALTCQKKLEEIKDAEKGVTQLTLKLEQIHNRIFDLERMHRVNERFDDFMKKWYFVVGKISRMLSTLTTATRPKDITSSQHELILHQITNWLIATNNTLDELDSNVKPGNERNKRVVQITQQLNDNQTHLSYLRREVNKSRNPQHMHQVMKLEQKFRQLLQRIEDLREAGGKQTTPTPTTTRVQLQQITRDELELANMPSTSANYSSPLIEVPVTEDEMDQALRTDEQESNQAREQGLIHESDEKEWIEWLKKIEVQLTKIGECFPGDLKRLNEELELCDQIILELREKLQQLRSEDSTFSELMQPPMEQVLRAAEAQRDCCQNCINKTQIALHKSVKVEEIADLFQTDLNWLMRNPKNADLPLREKERKLQNIRESLNLKLPVKAEALKMLDEIIILTEKCSTNESTAVRERLKERMKALEHQWTRLGTELDENIYFCRTERKKRIEDWIQRRSEYLDDLDEALRMSIEATDAEELSVSLDNLERTLERLKSLELEDNEEGYSELVQILMADDRKLGEELSSVETKANILIPTTRSRCDQLRRTIEKFESLEQTLCKFQLWCTQMLRIVNLRQAADIFAIDVSREYKDAYTSGTLIQLMEKEIAEHESLLDELAETLESNGYGLAPNGRLQLELDHATSQINELKTKFKSFQPPVTIWDKIKDLDTQLVDIENSLDDIVTVVSENCEFCLLHVKNLQKKLDLHTTESSKLEAEKDILIRNAFFDEQDAVKITSTINELLNKCLILSQRATITTERLGRALQLLQKCDNELDYLEQLISKVELSETTGESKDKSRDVMKWLAEAEKSTARTQELVRLIRQDLVEISPSKQAQISKNEKALSQLKQKFLSSNDDKKAEDELIYVHNEDDEGILFLNKLGGQLRVELQSLEEGLDAGEINSAALRSKLNELRPQKEKFETKASEMIDRDDHQKIIAPQLSDFSAKWEYLDRYFSNADTSDNQKSVLPTLHTPMYSLIRGEQEKEFGSSVEGLLEAFKNAYMYLDFKKFPVQSIEEWETRLKEVNNFEEVYKLRFDILLAEGKKVAESGRLELDNHKSLADLDVLIDLVKQIDDEYDSNEKKIVQARNYYNDIKHKLSKMHEDIDYVYRQINDLNPNQLNTSMKIHHLATNMDGDYKTVCTLCDEFKRIMPNDIDIKSYLFETLSLQQLELRLKELQQALELLDERSTKDGKNERKGVSEQQSSASSGPQLAMDAGCTTDDYEIRGNETEGDDLHLNISVQPSLKLQQTTNLSQFLTNLDSMEEYMETPEQLPFEGIEQKLEILQEFEVELDRSERFIESQQMIMGVEELNHITQRIDALRNKINNKRRELDTHSQKMNTLDSLLRQCESMIAKLGNSFNTFKKSQNEMETEEWEVAQKNLEDQLAPIGVRLQQCQNRLGNISSQLSKSARDEMHRSLHQIAIDFNEYIRVIREQRQKLEERLTDRAHLNHHLELIEFWCTETEAFLKASTGSILDAESFEQYVLNIRQRQSELPGRLEALRSLERLKDSFLALSNVDPEVKHEIRRNVAQLSKRLSDLKTELKEKLEQLDENFEYIRDIWKAFNQVKEWVENAQEQIKHFNEARIYKPSVINIEKLSSEIDDNRQALKSIQFQIQGEIGERILSKEEKQNYQHIIDVIEELELLNKQVDIILARCENDINEPESSQQNGFNERPQLHRQASASTTPSTSIGSNKEKYEPNIEYGELSLPDENEGVEQKPTYLRTMGLEERTRLDMVTRLRSWISEVQRESEFVGVDISDQNLIRQAIGKIQNWIDETKLQHENAKQIFDDTEDRLIRDRAQICVLEMDKTLNYCIQRKEELKNLLEQTRMWDKLRMTIELWLNEVSEKILDKTDVSIMDDDDDAMSERLDEIYKVVEELNDWKEKMEQFNDRSNEILDAFHKDDGHNFSHLTSKLNTYWTKFNEKVNIQRAKFEVAKQFHHDYQIALNQIELWMQKQAEIVSALEQRSSNKQQLKDTKQRNDWLTEIREICQENEAHNEMVESVRRMDQRYRSQQNQVYSEEGSTREMEAKVNVDLQKRFQSVETAWQNILSQTELIRNRLENAQEEFEKLLRTLGELLYWTEQQIKTVDDSQRIGVAGDLDGVQKQNELIKRISDAIITREREVHECIYMAHSYLMQHDLRPPISSVMLHDEGETNEENPYKVAERRIGLRILADSNMLQSQWIVLKERCANWSQSVISANQDMHQLAEKIAEALLAMEKIDDEFLCLRSVEDLLLEELKDARIETNQLYQRMLDSRVHLDDVNDISGQVAAKGIQINENLNSTLMSVNQRYERLKRDIESRESALERAFLDFGPSSGNYLVDLVDPPWQRAISANHHLPYYINHNTHETQWDHPAMVDILEQLGAFNQIKYSAYRTAMKLRALQKRLFLDLIGLIDLDRYFEKHLQDYFNEKEEILKLDDAIQCLISIFELIHRNKPNLLKNVSLAVDLALNLLLNIYDSCREGKMRVISFKIALVVLCSENLESKYKYLFQLISDNEGANQKQLAILFYNLLHIPKFLGEAAAFGGSNIEPSVRSCFEFSKFPLTIHINNLLDWLRKEPQSLVWLPVMHRLASSECAKHSAKCNVCKMFPIIGLRYRCLRCFNFDICQNCFFSQRTAKGHKLTHPMQEYCTPTQYSDDVRDFTKMMKNKVKRGRSRIGYLPVEGQYEGPVFEQVDTVPRNHDTETIHQRLQLFSARLEQREKETLNFAPNKELQYNGNPSDQSIYKLHFEMAKDPARFGMMAGSKAKIEDVKSPHNLISDVEKMRKEELDQLLQKLKYENYHLKMTMEQRRQMLGDSKLQLSRLSRQPSDFQQRYNETCQSKPDNTMFRSPETNRAMSVSSMNTFIPTDRGFLQSSLAIGRSVPSLQPQMMGPYDLGVDENKEREILMESRQLRVHQQRLEQRSKILEDQNRQLETQLKRLQKLVERNKSTPMLHEGPEKEKQALYQNGFVSSSEIDTDLEGLGDFRHLEPGKSPRYIAGEIRRNRMENLQNTAKDISRALETFFDSVKLGQVEHSEESERDDEKRELENDKNGK